MTTDRDFIEYITEQVGLGRRLTSKQMFGEYAPYLDGKVQGLRPNNSFKPNPHLGFVQAPGFCSNLSQSLARCGPA
jgi:hypothetical protein